MRRLRCVYLHRGQHRKIHPGKPHCRKSTQKQNKTKKNKTKTKRTENTFRLLRTAACTCILHRQVMYESITWAFGQEQISKRLCVRTHASQLHFIFHGMQAGRAEGKTVCIGVGVGKRSTLILNNKIALLGFCLRNRHSEEQEHSLKRIKFNY